MSQAGTNTGLGKRCTRLAIQPGILARSLAKPNTSHAFLHLESRKQCPHLGQPSPLYRVWAILNAEVSRRLFREIWRPKARKYVPSHVNIFSASKPINWWIVAAQVVFRVAAVADVVVVASLVQLGYNTGPRTRSTVQRSLFYCLRKCQLLFDGLFHRRARLSKSNSCPFCPTSFAATNYQQRITLYISAA